MRQCKPAEGQQCGTCQRCVSVSAREQIQLEDPPGSRDCGVTTSKPSTNNECPSPSAASGRYNTPTLRHLNVGHPLVQLARNLQTGPDPDDGRRPRPTDLYEEDQQLLKIQQAFSEMGSCNSHTKLKSPSQLEASRNKDPLHQTTNSSNRNKLPVHKHVVTASDQETVQISRAEEEPTIGIESPIPYNSFKVLKIKASIDKKPTTIDEKSEVIFKYRSPHFRAMATVEVPALPKDCGLQVGWIQACTDMNFVNTYGKEGVTSWEFPELESGKFTMVSDSDNELYPWYGVSKELSVVHGPSPRQTVSVHMNDNFFPQVTWYIPHSLYDKKPRLTRVYRNQKFVAFLLAKLLWTNQYYVLRTVTWSIQINIKVNPEAPLGKRAHIAMADYPEQPQPHILDNNPIILERQALLPPNANLLQALIWRPTNGEPRVVVPPESTTMNMEKYLLGTRDLGQKKVKCGKLES